MPGKTILYLYHCRWIEAHRDRSVARDCLESLHTIATHHWICGSQPQLRLLLTKIFSKINLCRVSISIIAMGPAPCDKNNSHHYSSLWLYLSHFWSGGIKRTTQVVKKKWHCIFAVFYLRQQTTSTSTTTTWVAKTETYFLTYPKISRYQFTSELQID